MTQRYSLNAKQIYVLKLMYKFRFITSSLLASYKGINVSSSKRALKILLDQKYIGKKYEKEYRIQGKGTRYYLLPEALKLLRAGHDLNEQVLLNMYKNKSLSSTFIDHNIDIMTVCVRLRGQYPDSFHIFTKSELGTFGYFPDPKPDLFLNRIKPSENMPNEYMLDIFTDPRLFLIKKRMDAYIEHYDTGDWEDVAETDYPVILIACPDSRAERSIQRYITKTLDSMGIDELRVYTTTTKALLSPETQNTNIWSNVFEPERVTSLNNL
jgi:hypothetical protein